MPQLVFVHGPGAGACHECYVHQLSHFEGSVAPDLPGHLEGTACADVKGYTEWLRGWLWAQGLKRDLVLVGFTLGACIALEYALDYPEEVAGLALMTVAIRPKTRPANAYQMRLDAASQGGEAYEKWREYQEHALMFVDSPLKEQLMARQIEVGPMQQYRDLVAIDGFDVRDRIAGLKQPLLLIRGNDDPTSPPQYEEEIMEVVSSARLLRLDRAGHFPMVERPAEVNAAIEELMAGL